MLLLLLNQVNISLNTSASTRSPSKASKPLKKVDLGAAATYAKEEAAKSHTRTSSTVSSDLLNEDFNPRCAEQTDSGKPEFGDFEAAFGAPATTQQHGDGFADFTSAFVPSPPAQPQQQQVVVNAAMLSGHVLMCFLDLIWYSSSVKPKCAGSK